MVENVLHMASSVVLLRLKTLFKVNLHHVAVNFDTTVHIAHDRDMHLCITHDICMYDLVFNYRVQTTHYKQNLWTTVKLLHGLSAIAELHVNVRNL